MPDRFGGLSGEALAAGEVVGRPGVLRVRLDDGATLLHGARVVAGPVERVQGRPELPAERLVRLPGDAAHGEHGRRRLFGERGPPRARGDEDEGARRRVDLLVA